MSTCLNKETWLSSLPHIVSIMKYVGFYVLYFLTVQLNKHIVTFHVLHSALDTLFFVFYSNKSRPKLTQNLDSDVLNYHM